MPNMMSEETAHFCSDFRHLSFLTDVTNEGRPQSIATAQVPAAEDRFCDKSGRFGPHASNEEFGPPFYQKIVFISYFNAGIRAFDIRDPYNPQEVASFIPAVTPNTDYRCGPYQGRNRPADVVSLEAAAEFGDMGATASSNAEAWLESRSDLRRLDRFDRGSPGATTRDDGAARAARAWLSRNRRGNRRTDRDGHVPPSPRPLPVAPSVEYKGNRRYKDRLA
jgi:hypothetical protein